MEEKYLKRLGIAACVLLLVFIDASCTPSGRAMFNRWNYEVQKADDATNYKTLKKVEDTCRSMISSYESDKLTYEQYKDSDNEEKRSWAEQAKMRANKTANIYNEYILKNSYVFEGTVPNDIDERLEMLE